MLPDGRSETKTVAKIMSTNQRVRLPVTTLGTIPIWLLNTARTLGISVFGLDHDVRPLLRD